MDDSWVSFEHAGKVLYGISGGILNWLPCEDDEVEINEKVYRVVKHRHTFKDPAEDLHHHIIHVILEECFGD